MRLSVLVATHQRRELLRLLLRSLGRQTQSPQDFEVVVVVDGSRDGTREMLGDYRPRAPYRLSFDHQPQCGKPAAINRAAAMASAPYCLVLDDDMAPAPELVAEHLRLQEERDGVVGVGPMKLEIPADADGMTQWFSRGWEERYERIRRSPEALTYKRCFGGNLSFPRSAFLQVGGWLQLDRGGDVELGYRLERSGLSVVCAPQAWATQHFPGGFRHIAWNAERSGLGGVATYELHPATLPITVGHFREATPRSLLLRELLLLSRPSARLLALADPIVRRLRVADAVYAVIHSYFLWRGVRTGLGADDRWRALKRGTVIVAYEVSARGRNCRRRHLGRMRILLQMYWLKLRGYNVLSLDEYVRERSEFQLPRPRSVVVTLEGRWPRLMDVAARIVSKVGLPVTVFVAEEDLRASPPPSRSELAELVEAGLGFGLDARSAELAPASGDRALKRIAGGRKEVESLLGQSVAHLAHRSSGAEGRLAELAEQAGFASACGPGTGTSGPATPIHALRRVHVTGRLSFARFLLAVWNGRPHRPT